MITKIVGVILIVLALNNFVSCFEIQPRIVNGSPSERGQFPFYVHIDTRKRHRLGYISVCGGALINQKFVLTAGHCLYNTEKASLYMGTLRINEAEFGRQYIFVKHFQFHIHPEFEIETLRHDIGLIKLRDRPAFTHFVQPISLPSTCNIPTGMEFMVVGNGNMENDGKPADILQYTTLKTTPYSECDALYNIVDYDAVFCAQGSNNNSICQGDSGKLSFEVDESYLRDFNLLFQILNTGGPLFDPSSRTVYGIASFTGGDEICNEFPNGFTNVIHYLNWISQITRINVTKCD